MYFSVFGFFCWKKYFFKILKFNEKDTEKDLDEMCETIERYANEIAVEEAVDAMIDTCRMFCATKEKNIRIVAERYPQISEEQISNRLSELWDK